ncbi:type II toxin-antitoxin system RelE/ParE family toxin, partial [Escherichia coli]|uniref:type II toxin-antitoxin system RelE/ParE family toxin n=1 Tax=Escherichia coli TaxID=562 RepID=UPI00201B1807
MEIFWTMLASQDRKRIREYIAEQNLMAAIELDERIGYSASSRHCCKVSDEAAFCLIQRPYISKTLLT